MREQFEQLCQDVTQAVNAAAPGRVITDGEEKVRDLLARFRQQTFQAAVQLRLEAAQVDGAEWIRNQIKAQSLPLDARGLDFYHLAENVHKARRAVYGGDSAEGKAWAASVLHLARHHSYREFEEAVGDWAFRWRGAKRKAALTLGNYISDREEMIRYKEFKEHGRQIGSGPTESMCKATTLRVKGIGKKWDADNAEAVMILEALDQSGAWEKYWNLAL
jgi:hypothetical protein